MNREQIEKLWSDKSHWTWGILYRCREDPRVIVPRRWRWGGWTLNFAHPKAGIAGLAAFALAVGPALLTLLMFGNQVATLIVMLLSILALIIWVRIISAGSPCERH